MIQKLSLFLLLTLTLLRPLHVYAGTVEIPRTGQAASYAAGDDGALQTGVAWPIPRFTDNGDQTITDKLTGLMWEKNAYKGNYDKAANGVIVGTSTWQTALDTAAYYNSISYLGHSDWRLPNINELKSLVNIGAPDQSQWLMSQGFANVLSQHYRTSTSPSMMVNMADGGVATNLYSYAWFVRGAGPGVVALPETGRQTCSGSDGSWRACSGTEDANLRMGIEWPDPRFTDNSLANPADLTLLDNLTGLVWPKNAGLAGKMTWQQALDFIETLNSTNYLGYNDWRLPNLNELQTLSHAQYSDYFKYHVFLNYQLGYYWSSSTYAKNTIGAWVKASGSFYTSWVAKTSLQYVLPVRGGGPGLRTPVINWTKPYDIVYGTPIAAVQLNATTDVEGTFVYTPVAGTVLDAGTHTLSVTFTPSDTARYKTSTKTVTINVVKATPAITWADPVDLVYGAALSTTQLNATADVAGAFFYSPAAGTVLNAGPNTLTVIFTPADTANYTIAAATVGLTVLKADQTMVFPAIATRSVGDPDFDPGATASSGLAVSYTSSDSRVASISGGMIHIIGGGTATITAWQAGDANYNPASQTQPLKVTGRPSKKPALTINAPADGTVTSDASLSITGNVDGLHKKDTLIISIANNGTTTSVPVQFAVPSGNFSGVFSLGGGENVIEIAATNHFGTTFDRRTILLRVP
ncbi:DUF1566 domain-containing protein [Geomonas subterranea]|uniref:DUF1566 domain-containing protein n=1 Tax=Geomonas subterranea TaxID=2847989 RepID=A0ABX8LI41_9BACT|nr:DUF1566 domain-containing protein [Geomonas subterranea]QXE90370.1 DUF1566 domain-containing protein [Geomonas subterranea]QXM07502.1 DUF1566 domain-containing protein [Geomonas subterranea]